MASVKDIGERLEQICDDQKEAVGEVFEADMKWLALELADKKRAILQGINVGRSPAEAFRVGKNAAKVSPVAAASGPIAAPSTGSQLKKGRATSASKGKKIKGKALGDITNAEAGDIFAFNGDEDEDEAGHAGGKGAPAMALAAAPSPIAVAVESPSPVSTFDNGKPKAKSSRGKGKAKGKRKERSLEEGQGQAEKDEEVASGPNKRHKSCGEVEVDVAVDKEKGEEGLVSPAVLREDDSVEESNASGVKRTRSDAKAECVTAEGAAPPR